MKKITQEELNEILRKHKLWIEGKEDGEKANLSYANLSSADLSSANLSYADLSYADLSYADLSYANLNSADLRDITGIEFPLACPSNGEFTAWKICRDDRIVKLLIPADAKRLSATGFRCRCDKATVLAVESIDGKKQFTEALSQRDSTFVYRVGETVTVDDFDDNRWNECSTGIHFFCDRATAARY